MDLRLFGAVHVDRPGKVASELWTAANDADALFFERPDDPMGVRILARLCVRAPMAAVGFALAALVQLVFLVPLVRDVRPVEQVVAGRLADENDVPVHGVDPLGRTLADWGGPGWVIANWVVLAALVVAAPLAGVVTAVGLVAARVVYVPIYRRSESLGTLTAVLAFGGVTVGLVWTRLLSGWVVAGGFVAFAALVRLTISRRDAEMAERTATIGEREGYDDGCLVAGRAHVPGLRHELGRRDLVPTTVYRSRFLRSGVTVEPDPTARSPDGARPDPDARDVFVKRSVAALLDLVGAGVVASVAALLCVPLYGDVFSDTVGGLVAIFVAAVVGFCYYAVPEALNGQTPGKSLVGAVAVATDGSSLSTRDAVVRNLLRPVDAVFCYGFGVLVAMVSDGQRLGDIAANTVVVETVTSETEA